MSIVWIRLPVMKTFSIVGVRLSMKTKKPKKMTLIEAIKSVRKELPPKEQVILVKKNLPFRKRKYKGKIDITME
jgi:hypothetical protein